METRLRELMQAVVGDPPHRVTAEAVRRRVVRRRRRFTVIGAAAAVAVIATVIPAFTGAYSEVSQSGAGAAGAIMYVAAPNGVIPVATDTNTPGSPIKIGALPAAIAITPDARTAYIADLPDGHPGTVTPVATTTNTPGTPIKIGGYPQAIAITPDGKTAYVAGMPDNPKHPGTVIPVATGTNTPGTPIKIGGYPAAIAITPNGKTAYVVSFSRTATTVRPVATATNTPGTPISIGGGYPRAAPIAVAIAITPDGKTAYVVRATARRTTITPVATATNRAGTPINIGGIGHFTDVTAIAISPDGKTAYIADGHHRTVIPVATATNTPGTPIKINGTPVAIAITPDGKTAYIATAAYIARRCTGCPVGTVIPVATATGTPGNPIIIGRIPQGIAITP